MGINFTNQLFLLIRLITTFTIISFSSVRLSAIINVSATSVLLPINLEPSDLYNMPFFSSAKCLINSVDRTFEGLVFFIAEQITTTELFL